MQWSQNGRDFPRCASRGAFPSLLEALLEPLPLAHLGLVVQAGREIPPQWDMPDLFRTVITDDQGMGVIPSFLRDTYYDLMLHGDHSWVFRDILAWIDLINYAPQV